MLEVGQTKNKIEENEYRSMHWVWVKTRFGVKKVTKSNRYGQQKRIFVNVEGKRID